MSVLEYKCPHCGGAVNFDSASQQMTCPYCDSTFEIAALEEHNAELRSETVDDFGWGDYQNGEWSSEEIQGLSGYRCPSCAGEIVGDATTAATHCPYCGNPAVLPKQLEGMFKPDFVIPFKVDKEAVKAGLEKHLKGKRLLPKLFKAQNRIDSIVGLYVPFWLFDCKAKGQARYQATRVSTWSDSKYNYTKTDYYSVIREGGADFARVPADGSKKMQDTLMESIEPYDYSQMIDFQSAYLSGFLADKYDVTGEECQPYVNERVKKTTEAMLRETVTGYHSCVAQHSSVQFSDGKVAYALMPAWVMSTKYKDKVYTFVMNGQTGKFVGDLPISWGRLWAWFFGLFGGFSAAGFLFLLLIDVLGG